MVGLSVKCENAERSLSGVKLDHRVYCRPSIILGGHFMWMEKAVSIECSMEQLEVWCKSGEDGSKW